MVNLTISIDDDLFPKERIRALSSGTSVSALLRNHDKRAAAVGAIAATDHPVVSTQVLGEFYVTVTRKLDRLVPGVLAREAVLSIGGLAAVSPVDADMVTTARSLCESVSISYWDALIIAAASASACDRRLTEDLSGGTELLGVRIENPFVA